MRAWYVLSVLLALYVAILFPLMAHMQARPLAAKIGYSPHPRALRLAAADQKLTIAAALVFRTMMYFGGAIEESYRSHVLAPDYEGMTQNVIAAAELDPYNMDAYYFAQAVLVWELGDISTANRLLERGMNYRDWDFYLPLFAGFNYAYFLKDYEKAARYYKRAGELSGAELYQSLASRYFYESRQTDFAIAYLRAMLKEARNDSVRESFRRRLAALEGIRELEIAIAHFRQKVGRFPEKLSELVERGVLVSIPSEPYGGQFYLDSERRVRTSSKLALGGR